MSKKDFMRIDVLNFLGLWPVYLHRNDCSFYVHVIDNLYARHMNGLMK